MRRFPHSRTTGRVATRRAPASIAITLTGLVMVLAGSTLDAGVRAPRPLRAVRTAHAVRGASSLHAQRPKLPTPIRHVVWLEQENNTWDSVFGATLCVQQPSRCSTPMPARVTLADGTQVTIKPRPDFIPNVTHSVASHLIAVSNRWDQLGGCSARSVPAFACLMAADASQETNLLALATRYAVDDMAFEDTPTPSYGAHLEDLLGGLDGFTGNTPIAGASGTYVRGDWGCTSGNDAYWRGSASTVTKQPSCVPCPAVMTTCGPYQGAYRPTAAPAADSILDRCDAAAIACRIYAAPTSQEGSNGPHIWSTCSYDAKILHSAQLASCRPVSQFLTDLAAGHLANVTMLYPENGPGGQTSQHNLTSMTVGDNWIGQVASALQASPDWSSTVFIIDYDDFGGFYDHVSPAAGHGFRVPFVVASPWVKPGFTDHTQALMAASPLAAIDAFFGLAPLGDSPAGYDLANMFDFTRPPATGTVPMVTRPISPAEQRQLKRTPPDPDDPT